MACIGLLCAACASTRVELTGRPPPLPLCQSTGENLSALVLWGPRWRANQKEPASREATAERAIRSFFGSSTCFTTARVVRVDVTPPLPLASHVTAGVPVQRILVLGVRELGPIIRLLGSPALVEGGTEVVLDVSSYDPATLQPLHAFSVHWQNGGPGVVKTTATLSDDLQATLAVALNPAAP